MSNTNGTTVDKGAAKVTMNTEISPIRNEALVAEFTFRRNFFSKLLDPRRDIDRECGFPSQVGVGEFSIMYERWGIAKRVVNIFPDQCWKVCPEVYEDEDAEVETAFELVWNHLKDNKQLFSYLHRIDRLSGIGHFGVLFLGFDDGQQPDKPVEGVEKYLKEKALAPPKMESKKKPKKKEGEKEEPKEKPTTTTGTPPTRNLLYLRPFGESLVSIIQWDENITSWRYGKPVMYEIKTVDLKAATVGSTVAQQPNKTMKVHWTRVLHVADNCEGNEVLGVPRQEEVYNYEYNCVKILASAGEGFWTSGFPKLSLESHPGEDVELDIDGTKEQMDLLRNNLQPYIALQNMTAKSIAPQVTDPLPHLDAQITAICISKNIPKRIFMGSERGELSSSQDSDEWADALIGRQKGYLTAFVIRPFIDILIGAGVLPEPKEVKVDWPDIKAPSETDKATTVNTITTAMATYVSGNVQSLIPPMEYFTIIMGMDKDEAESIVEAAADQIELGDDPEDPMGRVGKTPPPAVDPNKQAALDQQGDHFGKSQDLERERMQQAAKKPPMTRK